MSPDSRKPGSSSGTRISWALTLVTPTRRSEPVPQACWRLIDDLAGAEECEDYLEMFSGGFIGNDANVLGSADWTRGMGFVIENCSPLLTSRTGFLAGWCQSDTVHTWR